MVFEWDDLKAAQNVAKHGVPFEYANFRAKGERTRAEEVLRNAIDLTRKKTAIDARRGAARRLTIRTFRPLGTRSLRKQRQHGPRPVRVQQRHRRRTPAHAAD